MAIEGLLKVERDGIKTLRDSEDEARRLPPRSRRCGRIARGRTAWFLGSTATQILVIFVICTYRPAWTGRAHPALVASSLGVLLVALVVVASQLGAAFSFVVMPWPMVAAIAVLVVAYLASAEAVKRFAGAGRR